MSDKEIIERISMLEEATKRATEAAARLLKCAESISNPVYSVSMQGHRGELQIQAVRHFQGQICITVADPATVMEAERRNRIGHTKMIDQDVIDV